MERRSITATSSAFCHVRDLRLRDRRQRSRAAGDPYCTGSYGGGRSARGGAAALRRRSRRSPAASAASSCPQRPTTPPGTSPPRARLQPPGRVLVVRLNRLFWSGGDALLESVSRRWSGGTRGAGQDVELQVRYHPGSGEDGRPRGVAGATCVTSSTRSGSNRRVVAMTITNEVNVTFSPNTSDGAYTGARDALIEGIEAAHDEALRRGVRPAALRIHLRVPVLTRSTTPRSSPISARTAASALQQALGFVGLDFYPGSVYPPVMAPGDTYRGGDGTGAGDRCAGA